MTEHSADTVERVAVALWKAELQNSGASRGAIDRRTAETFQTEQSEATREKWRKFARAALSALTVEDAAKVVLDANIKNQLAKSPAFFLHFHAWEGYKKGVQDYTAALRAIADTPKEGE